MQGGATHPGVERNRESYTVRVNYEDIEGGVIGTVNQRQAEILRQMMEHSDKYFTIKEISATRGVVYQTARTDLLGLAEQGHIRKEKRSREFVFNETCDLWKEKKKQAGPSPPE